MSLPRMSRQEDGGRKKTESKEMSDEDLEKRLCSDENFILKVVSMLGDESRIVLRLQEQVNKLKKRMAKLEKSSTKKRGKAS